LPARAPIVPSDLDHTTAAELESAADGLDAVAAEAGEAAELLREVGEDRRRGNPWRELLEGPRTRKLLQLSGSASQRLSTVAARLRRAVARGLAGNGMRVGEVAKYLGVSHQRVSVLLNDDRPRA
jgi:hypothetical protein